MSKKSEPKIVQRLFLGGRIFAWEEYWTEDNDGFCSVDFLWEKHTRLKVLDSQENLLQEYDFDSGQREKDLKVEKGCVHIDFRPSYLLHRSLLMNPDTLEILEDCKTQD